MRATYLLGECYENGYGVEKDEKKAAELYTQAHKGGHLDGTCSLGSCYMKGTGVEKDPFKAAALYGEAAAQGSPRGLYLKARCCELGQGTDRDLEMARTLYQQAADKGYKKAADALAALEAAQTPVHSGQRAREVPEKKPEAPKKRSWWPFKKK